MFFHKGTRTASREILTEIALHIFAVTDLSLMCIISMSVLQPRNIGGAILCRKDDFAC
jgi:hypothetical protein